MTAGIMEALDILAEEMQQYREPFEAQGMAFSEHERTNEDT